MEGWRREMYFDDDRPHLDHLVAQHPDASTRRPSIPGARAVRGHQRVRRARHDAAVRAARRAVGRRGAVCRRDEPARAARACSSARRCSSRRSTSTPARAAPAARSTCSTARTFRPVEAGVALIEAFRASDPGQFRWRDPPYEYELEKLPIDMPGRVVRAARSRSTRGVPAREIARSWEAPVAAFKKIRERFLLY